MAARKLKIESLESKDMLTGPPAPADNLGALTKWAIHEFPNWDQGEHSSDPSGDGVGRDGVEDRVGLANVVEPHNLQATVDFVAAAIGAPSS